MNSQHRYIPRMDFKEIIDKWPDRQAFADDTYQHRGTINQWHMRNKVPQESWYLILVGAKKRRIKLKAMELIMAATSEEDKKC